MLKPLFATLLLASLASFAAESTPLTRTFAYQGKTYRTSIAPSGIFYQGMFGKTQVFTNISVVGSYRDTAEKYDTRLFQNAAKNVSCTLEQLGNNRVRIISVGTVGNAKYPEAATYRQTTLFEPDRIKIDYQYTTKVPMATHMDIFNSIMNFPLPAVVDRGLSLTDAGKKEELLSVPAV